jgi:hypothetical protein
VANFIGKKKLKTNEFTAKNNPFGNMPTELFRWYISISDSGIYNIFFSTLWNIPMD